MALEALADGIEDIFNRIAIPRLFRLNGMNPQAVPKLKHGRRERVNIQELGEYIAKLAGAGMPLFPEDDLENYLRESAGMPLVPEDRELEVPQIPQGQMPEEDIPEEDEEDES